MPLDERPQPICRMQDLPVCGSKELEYDGEQYFAVRQDQEVYIYRNSCPHVGLPLNQMPDQFLDYDKRHIQCSSHGALFEIDTGLCIAGPCVNKSLEPIAYREENGEIFFV